MKIIDDKTMEHLLDLDGTCYVIDVELGLWVKFAVKKFTLTIHSPKIRYSLSLHNRFNQRIIGFDNAHAIYYGGKHKVAPKRTFDHVHYEAKNQVVPYVYQGAAKLLQDFWSAVDNEVKRLREVENE